MSVVIIKHGKTSRLAAGHPWVYAGEIAKVSDELKDGDTADIRDERRRFLGRGIFNSKSQIAVRRFTLGHDDLDEKFFRARLETALAWRRRIMPEVVAQNDTAFRVVCSESDFLPGVIIDRYSNALVLQTLTLGMDMRKGLIAKVASDLLCCDTVIERNDAPVRKLEGLEEKTGILTVGRQSLAAVGDKSQAGTPVLPISESHAESSRYPVQINGVKFSIDLLHGQKTGAYLDQRVNYRAVAAWAKGRRVLDAFCYQGGFALHCAKAGATSVELLDSSEDAIAAARENAKLNDVDTRCQFVAANAFDVLKTYQQEKREYDLIILDPPSFTRSKQQLEPALRGYKELTLRSLKMLNAGGMLATFCCSHHVNSQLFKEILVDAAGDARRVLRLVQTLTQSPDHPILPSVPETEYLKGFLVEVV
jgi:23S rRNA (cytosine1962-C5)-methyltransferase